MWVSLDEITGHPGVSRDTVFRWVENKGMPAHRIGHQWKFKDSQVVSWVEAGKAGTVAPEDSDEEQGQIRAENILRLGRKW